LQNGIKKRYQDKKISLTETPSLQEIKDCTNLRHNDIYDNFDSYTDVLIESGCYNVAPGRRIKIERLKKDIHSYYRQKEGGLPTTKEVAKFCVHDVYTFLRRFGPTWQDVLENVGFSDEDIIEYNQTEGDLDYGDNWRSVKANIRQRDGYVCRVCGHRNIDHNLDVHHIKPIRCFDSNTDYSDINAEGNLILLCRSCHRKLEGRFKDSNPEEFARLGKEYLGESLEEKSLFNY